MVEIITKKATETIIIQGNPQEIMGLKSANSEKGFLQAKINHFARFPDAKYSGKDVEMILRAVLGVHEKFHSNKVQVEINGWKGKSGIVEIIDKPDSIDIVRFRKLDQDSEPKRIVHNIPKRDINVVLNAILRNKDKEKIKSKEIALEYCKILNLNFNTHKRNLWDNDGFIWDNFFSDRKLHNMLVDILDLLDKKGCIHYRHGIIQFLNTKLEF